MSIPADAEGRSLTWRAGDLRARFMLNKMARLAWDHDYKRLCCTLLHAERYLSDRLAYELYPWPKNKLLARDFGGDDAE